VSYAHADEALVYPEIEWLNAQGFNVWYDEGIGPGTIWRDEIAASIENAALFLYFITPNSIERPHCQREVAFAMDREVPLLAVHLLETLLPGGMELSLNSIQAILRYQLSDDDYRDRLSRTASRYLHSTEERAHTAPGTQPVDADKYLFGGWEVNPQRNEVSRAGETKRLEPKVSAVLHYLLEHPGETVSTEALMDAVWPGRAIEPVGVARNIAQIRRELGDDARHPTYIETIPKRGYRTLAPVRPYTIENARAAVRSEAPEQQPVGARPEQNKALRWLVSAAGIVAIVVGGWIYLRSDSESTTVHAIAVLPFQNVSADRQHDYLADGLVIELNQNLAVVPNVRIVSAAVSSYYRKNAVDLDTIRERLNADYIVEGSVRASDNKLRVTAQLTDIRDGFQVWTQTFERDSSDLLELQRDLARAIITELPIVLDDAAVANAIQAGTISAEAHDLFLQAQALFRTLPGGKEDLARVQALLNRAIELDPQYYAAYMGLASTEITLATLPGGDSPKTAIANAIQLFENIEQSDLGSTRPYRAFERSFYASLRQDWPGVETIAREQLKQSAPEAEWLIIYSDLLTASGSMDTALAYLQAAEEIEPSNPLVKLRQAKLYYYLINPQKAAANADACLALQPDHSDCLGYKAWALSASGELDRALAMIEDTIWDSTSTRCYFRLQAGGSCDPNIPLDPTVPTANAQISMLRGDYDATFHWLNHAADNRRVSDQFRALAHGWPEDFKADPRWNSFLERIGLTDEWRQELCRRASTLEPYTGIAVDCHRHRPPGAT